MGTDDRVSTHADAATSMADREDDTTAAIDVPRLRNLAELWDARADELLVKSLADGSDVASDGAADALMDCAIDLRLALGWRPRD